jgi:hypothetical protein
MKLDPLLEKKLAKISLSYLSRGKPGWDVPHTMSTVHWMKTLLEHEKGNERILITTMYLHDIGYFGAFKKGYSKKDVDNMGIAHMERGAEEAKKVLKKLKYTDKEIQKIAKLIRHHGYLEKAKTHEQIMVLEADGLGQIDVDRVKPTYTKEDYLRFLDVFAKRRIPKYKTRTGKYHLKKLLAQARAYCKKNM